MALVLFDLNGTLLDPAATGDPVLPKALPLAVEMAMAHTLAGRFEPFADLVAAALGHHGAGDPEASVRRARRMPPFPDVAGGLDRLAAAGHRLVVLTNSAVDTAEDGLTAAGLRDRFEAVVGSDDAESYKPATGVYRGAVERLGRRGEEPWLVAAHWWDILGAAAAGLHTGYVARKGPLPPGVAADATAPDLDGIAAALAG